MLLLSLFLVVASVATLVVGWYFSEGITLIYASLATSIAAVLLVLIGVATHRRLQAPPDDASSSRDSEPLFPDAAVEGDHVVTLPPRHEAIIGDATYYDVLGIATDATLDEVRRAFTLRTGMYDLGRHPGASEQLRREAERAVRELEEAWSVLGDPTRRALYDARLQRRTSVGGA